MKYWHLKIAKTRLWVLQFCAHQCHKQGQNVRRRYQIHLEPTFFCSSLVKSKPAWLCPGEPQAKEYFFWGYNYWQSNQAKEYFFCGYNYWQSNQAEPADGNLCTLSTLPGQLGSSLHFPFNQLKWTANHEDSSEKQQFISKPHRELISQKVVSY